MRLRFTVRLQKHRLKCREALECGGLTPLLDGIAGEVGRVRQSDLQCASRALEMRASLPGRSHSPPAIPSESGVKPPHSRASRHTRTHFPKSRPPTTFLMRLPTFFLTALISCTSVLAAPVPIFDGKTLAGWEGDAKW